jgi:hypothetical protein
MKNPVCIESLSVIENHNAPEKIRFRASILEAQREMVEAIKSGRLVDRAELCPLRHRFTPLSKEYGCYTYAREIFIPKGTLIIGKIHKHQHLNFILKGKVSVNTEFGKKYFEAPCTFISEVGLKRAVYAEEDTIWTTVHLTRLSGENNLGAIEDELIAKSYDEIGLATENPKPGQPKFENPKSKMELTE